MKKNMGTLDRIVRVILAVIFIALAVMKGGAWWILGALGVVFILTSIVGFCPLYVPLGIKTTSEA